MKPPKLIIAALVSGRVKLTPEVLEILRKHGQDENMSEPEGSLPAQPPPTKAPEDVPPEHPETGESARLGSASLAQEPTPQGGPATGLPPASCRRRRMIFVSPLPGRWVRLCAMAFSCLALWLAPPVSMRAQEADFDAANRAAAAGGKWAEAARSFENLIARHGYSTSVLFNLANVQMAEGKWGPAILNYERARWLAPNDPDIAANLALARQKAGLEPESFSRLAAVAHSMTWTQWSVLATAMLWLTAAALPLRRMLPGARPVLTATALLSSVVLLTAISALALRRHDLDRAVVTAPETPARVSPVSVVPPSFTLRAGEPVSIKRTHGAFLFITNSQGREGWVNRETVTRVVS